jgi:transcriptional regulator with XRE-family HTH domain
MILLNKREYSNFLKNKGYTKAKLARKLGVTRSYITKLENGDMIPSSQKMFSLAEQLGCDIKDLFRKA